MQRPDGTLVTVYYFNDRLAGEGYIAATLWRTRRFGLSVSSLQAVRRSNNQTG